MHVENEAFFSDYFSDNLTHSTHQKKAVLNYESNANNGIIVLVVKKKYIYFFGLIFVMQNIFFLVSYTPTTQDRNKKLYFASRKQCLFSDHYDALCSLFYF